MKPPKFLKNIISIVFYYIMLKLVMTALAFFYFLFEGSASLSSLKYIDIITSERSIREGILFFSLEMIYTIIIFFVVFIIRKLIKDLEKEKLYSRLQISGLNLAGKLIIGVVILQIITEFILTIVFDNRLEMSVSFENDLGNPFPVITIGLFMIYLSKIFKNSARIQAENELTV